MIRFIFSSFFNSLETVGLECPQRSPSVWKLDSRFGMSPPFSQRLEAGQGGSGIIPIVDDRPGVGAEDRRIIVYSVDPQIEQDIHLRAFACLDQLVGFSNREKEEKG